MAAGVARCARDKDARATAPGGAGHSCIAHQGRRAAQRNMRCVYRCHPRNKAARVMAIAVVRAVCVAAVVVLMSVAASIVAMSAYRPAKTTGATLAAVMPREQDDALCDGEGDAAKVAVVRVVVVRVRCDQRYDVGNDSAGNAAARRRDGVGKRVGQRNDTKHGGAGARRLLTRWRDNAERDSGDKRRNNVVTVDGAMDAAARRVQRRRSRRWCRARQ